MSSPRKTLPPFRFSWLIPLYACIALLFAFLIKRGHVQLLDPKGYIAAMQSTILWEFLIFTAVVGTIMITAFIWVFFRYNEHNGHQYEPKQRTNRGAEMLGWFGQLAVIIVISVMVWNTAHEVDPYKTVSSLTATKSMTVQVVALQWKWLFIYPQQHIATVNYLEIPVGTPVTFKLTADAPMNSFWIPQLSGQIYAMTGMVNQLHIRADHPGTYHGGPAEISGDDFASMEFNVKAVSDTDFAAWSASAQNATLSPLLDYAGYNQLAKPKGYVEPATYRLPYDNLFDAVVMKFMVPIEDQTTGKKGSQY